ncbi:hypothetical protein Tco_0853207, partial [Tanacetum coccineum]
IRIFSKKDKNKANTDKAEHGNRMSTKKPKPMAYWCGYQEKDKNKDKSGQNEARD